LVNFQKRYLEILGKELAAARMELELKSEALICREVEMAEQGSIHHLSDVVIFLIKCYLLADCARDFFVKGSLSPDLCMLPRMQCTLLRLTSFSLR
jgi:hypothetical protein